MGISEPAIPLKGVVLFIACGTMVFIIVFIFAKRQITRFALKSDRGPHVAIGANGPKALKREIERRLKRVADIKHEPQLLSQATEHTIQSTFNGETCHFLYRMKAVDALQLLDAELEGGSESSQRKPGQLRSFLLDQRQSGPLQGIKVDLVEKFVAAYMHARHDPAEFKEEHYQEYMDLMNHLISHIRNKKNSTAPDIVDITTKTSKTPEHLPPTNCAITTDLSSNDKLDNNAAADDVQLIYRPRKNGEGGNHGNGDDEDSDQVGHFRLSRGDSASSQGSATNLIRNRNDKSTFESAV